MRPMKFHVVIPARLASSRLPNKPLADIAGLPMVVRVAHQAQRSKAATVTVATDAEPVLLACARHGIAAVMTEADHPSGSDRLAEACRLLGLDGDDAVVNVQGDEPLIEPALIDDCAATLDLHPDCQVGTVAHPLETAADWHNPNVVKVVLDAFQRALYFSRSPIPMWRDGEPQASPAACPAPVLRHVGIYAYRAAFLRSFPSLAVSPLERAEMLEQLRVMWHGGRIAVHIAQQAPAGGVDTPDDLERVRRALATPGG